MTVTVTYAGETKATNAKEIKVDVLKAIKDADKVALAADYSVKLTPVDTMVPSIMSVEAVGSKTLKLTFSEPVYDAQGNTTLENDLITVKSGIYTYSVTNSVADYAKKTVTLTLGTKLVDGDVTVKVNAPGMSDAAAIRDFAGLVLVPEEVVYSYAANTAVPTVELSTVNKATKKAKVVFSKPVYGTNVKLYHSVNESAAFGTTQLTKSEANAATEWEFEFTNELPSGTITFYLTNSDTASEQLTDLFGVKVPNQTFSFDIVTDVTAPTVTTVKADKNLGFEIEFSEDVKSTEVKATNFEVKDKDGDTVTFSATAKDSKTVKLTTSLTDNEVYTVTVKAMKDAAGNAMASAYTTQVTVGDNTNPVISSTYLVGANTIYVVYSEAMDQASITNKANYLVDATGSAYKALDADDTVELISEKKVKITFKDAGLVAGVSDLTVGIVLDTAGKRLGTDTTFYTIESNISSSSIVVEKAELIATDKVKLTFSKALGSFDASEMSIRQTDNGATDKVYAFQSIESNTVNSDSKSEVVIVLDNKLNANATDKSLTPEAIEVVVVGTPANTKSTENTVLTGGTEVTVADKVLPTFDVEWISKSTIHVVFDEVIDAAYVSALGTNGFSINGGKLTTALMSGGTGVDGTIIVLTSPATKASEEFTKDTDVTYTAGTIQDKNSNKLATVAVTDEITSAAGKKVVELEAAVALDLSIDANNTAAVAADTAADTEVAKLVAGATKTALEARITAAMAAITASDTVEAKVVTAETAAATAVTTTTLLNIEAAETALKAPALDGTYAALSAATKTALDARVATAKASVVADADFTFTAVKVTDTSVKYVIAGDDKTAGLTTGFTTVTTAAGTHSNAATLAVAANGAVTATDGLATGVADTLTTAVTYTYWAKMATFTTVATDAADTETLVVQ